MWVVLNAHIWVITRKRRHGAFGHYPWQLLYGAAKSRQRLVAFERLRELVNLPLASSLPEMAAEAYGTIRAELEAKGELIGNNDPWIAAPAVSIRIDIGYKQPTKVPARAWPEGTGSPSSSSFSGADP